MGWGTGLTHAIAQGLVGYEQGRELGSRQLINEIARRQAAQRAEEEAQLKRDEFEHRKAMDEAELVTKGYTPASTTIATEAAAPSTAPTPSFRDLLTAGLGATAGPVTAPLTGPVTGGEGSATPADGSPTDGPPADVSLVTPVDIGRVPKLTITETPASFDPLATTQGALEAAREEARAEGRREMLASQEARAKAANQSRELIAHLRAANGGSRVGRPISAAAKEANARQAARALLNIFGTPEAAKQWRASPEGAEARAQGITPLHIDIAAGLRIGDDTKAGMQVIRQEMAGMPASDSSARTNAEQVMAQVRAVRRAATPLSGKQLQRASLDPDYRQFLEEQGYRLIRRTNGTVMQDLSVRRDSSDNIRP